MTQETIITLLSAAVAVLTAVVALLLCCVAHLRRQCKRKNVYIARYIRAYQTFENRMERLGVSRTDMPSLAGLLDRDAGRDTD